MSFWKSLVQGVVIMAAGSAASVIGAEYTRSKLDEIRRKKQKEVERLQNPEEEPVDGGEAITEEDR